MQILVLWRLVTLSVILSLLSIGIVSLLSYFNNRNYVITRMGARYQNIAYLKMQQIDQYLNSVNISAYTVSTRLVLRDESTNYFRQQAVNETYLTSILSNAVLAIPDITSARVLGLRSQLSNNVTTPPVQQLAVVNQTRDSARIFPEQGLTSGLYGPYWVNNGTFQVLGLSVPIYSRNQPLVGQQVGILQALFESKAIENIVSSSIVGNEPSSQVLLISRARGNDQNATIIFKPVRAVNDTGRIISFAQDPAVRECFYGTGYLYNYINYRDEKVTSGYAAANRSFPTVYWGLVYDSLQEEVYAPIAYLQNVLLATFFSVLVFTILVSFVCIYRALKPLQRLNRETSKAPVDMRFEDPHRWFGLRIQDEFSILAKNFSNLVQQLNRQNLNLEVLVANRTSALADAERRAVAANASKSNFLANMSHELRTPLTAILGMVDVHLAADKEGASYPSANQIASNRELLETFTIIKTSGEHLLYLLNDILDLAKIESGHLELEMQPFELGTDLIDRVWYMFKSQAHNAGLELKVSLSPSILRSRRVIGDVHRLRQILFNLVNNAIKFTAKGTIQILMEQRDNTQEDYIIHVRDTGCGMSPEVVSKLYQPFQQADASTTRKFGGTGLGLAVTHQLIRLMNGTIQVESELDVGTVFHVALHLDTAADNIIRPPLPSSSSLSHSPATTLTRRSSTSHIHILLVDDNSINLKVISRMLITCGIQESNITLAHNGQEALDLVLAAIQFDIIFMDLQMPVMDGYEAARRIIDSQLFKGRLIALTANAHADSQAECLKIGMHDVLTKPIKMELLIELLN